MTTKRKTLLCLCGFAIIGIIIWSVSIKREGVSSETIRPSIKPVDFSGDLDYLVSQMNLLASHLPHQASFASNVIEECASLRNLFAQSFQSPVQGSIDFILQVHPDALGGPTPPGYDPDRSKELVSKVILENKYDIVTFEGSGFDGFSLESRAKEVHARLKYQPESPLHQGLVQRGVDPSSYEQVRPYLVKMMGSQDNPPWYELEKKTTSAFMAGESIPLTILMGKLVSGEIGHSNRRAVIENVQRLRSAYALAKTISNLKSTGKQRAAIVFGFLHKNDFKNLASALGIKARVYNATGRKLH